MNVPDFKVFKNVFRGWYAETYIFGNLITTCKRAGGSVSSYATPATKMVDEKGFTSYRMDGMDMMTKKEPLFTAGKQATEKTIERCHASALLLFIDKHNPEALEAANV